MKDKVYKILFIACRRIQSNWGSGVDIFPLLPAPTSVLPLGPVLCLGPAVPLLRDRDRRSRGDQYWQVRGQYSPLLFNQVAEDFRASISIANEDSSVKINFQGPVLPVDRCQFFSTNIREIFLSNFVTRISFHEFHKQQTIMCSIISQGSIIREKINDVSQLLDGPLPGNAVAFIRIFSQHGICHTSGASWESLRWGTVARRPDLWTSLQRWMWLTVWPWHRQWRGHQHIRLWIILTALTKSRNT